MSEPRILLYDIETSQNLVAVFQLANQDWIDPSSIIQERYIICGAYRWLGQHKIHSVSVLDDPKRYAKNPHDDKHVVETLYNVMSQADVIVGHNSSQFDDRFVKTRALVHGFRPLPPYQSLDTYKLAKSVFMLNSNRLNYIGKLLGVGQKKTTAPGLWLRVLSGDKSAVREMVAYNKQDVVLLDKVFHKLSPYMPNHINRQLFGGHGCPGCGSHKLQARGWHHAISRSYQRYQCQACGRWSRDDKAAPKRVTKRSI